MMLMDNKKLYLKLKRLNKHLESLIAYIWEEEYEELKTHMSELRVVVWWTLINIKQTKKEAKEEMRYINSL